MANSQTMVNRNSQLIQDDLTIYVYLSLQFVHAFYINECCDVTNLLHVYFRVQQFLTRIPTTSIAHKIF